MRKIIHIDMDAFYASVEQRDNPDFRGKPLVVGGSPFGFISLAGRKPTPLRVRQFASEGNPPVQLDSPPTDSPNQRGVVAAASYEARKFGIHSGMSARVALSKCPNLIFVKPRFEIYRAISTQIHDIFRRHTDVFEPVALDEAYLDVTENKQNIPYASTIARCLRAEIFTETQLTASAGVSINKFLAKMASGANKPNGMTVILPEQAQTFVEALPVEKFHGIGKVTAAKMHSMGIKTGADLKTRALSELTQHFGKAGHYYYKIARGEDDRAVEANRVRKSIGAETSFTEDLSDTATMLLELEQIAQELKQRIDKNKARGRTLTLKVKFSLLSANYPQ